MAVDHGLGGRDSEKSRIRRERKAKRLRLLAKKLQSEDVPHSRKEVKFDENARAAFLTGFHQRKQERRKFGLTMQILREKKFRKEAAKSRNKALEKSSAEARKRDLAIPMPAGSDDEEDDEEDDEDGEGDEEGSVFADDATVSMFGSAVNVVVSDAIGDNDDASPFASGHLRALAAEEDSDEEGEEGEEGEGDDDTRSVSSRLSASSAASAHRKRGKKELSNFERAMKKVKQTMGNRKKKRHNVEKNPHRSKHQRKVEKKTESRKLLTKYLGSKGISLKKRKD